MDLFATENVMLKTLLLVLVLVGYGWTLYGCETTEGAGKDIKHAGQDIQNAAENNK
jgi:predicted small secreted protein